MLIILKYFLSMTNPTDRAHFFTNVNLPLNLPESCGRYFFKVHQVHFLKNNSSLALGSNYSICIPVLRQGVPLTIFSSVACPLSSHHLISWQLSLFVHSLLEAGPLKVVLIQVTSRRYTVVWQIEGSDQSAGGLIPS